MAKMAKNNSILWVFRKTVFERQNLAEGDKRSKKRSDKRSKKRSKKRSYG
jgi:hypothetical protein